MTVQTSTPRVTQWDLAERSVAGPRDGSNVAARDGQTGDGSVTRLGQPNLARRVRNREAAA